MYIENILEISFSYIISVKVVIILLLHTYIFLFMNWLQTQMFQFNLMKLAIKQYCNCSHMN